MRNPKEVKRFLAEPALIKKSFNISPDLAQPVDDFIRSNPGISFTLIMNQALKTWLADPKITLKETKSFDSKDLEDFMDENAELLDDLSR